MALNIKNPEVERLVKQATGARTHVNMHQRVDRPEARHRRPPVHEIVDPLAVGVERTALNHGQTGIRLGIDIGREQVRLAMQHHNGGGRHQNEKDDSGLHRYQFISGRSPD